MSIRAVPPLPFRQDWAPSYLSARPGAMNRDFAFRLRDAQGAPSADGSRYHSGVDVFAPAHTGIRAPGSGHVRRAVSGGGSVGQVFGGILEIEEPGGIVWVMRHVQPTVALGRDVLAGDPVARVAPWSGGGPHLHLEIWRSAAGGYRHENMIDPADVEWTEQAAPNLVPASAYFIEELPHTHGGRGPAVVGQRAGYARASLAKVVALALRARGRLVSTVREGGRTYVLSWAPGTYGERFRFGPWASAETAEFWQRKRQANTGRTIRRYEGKARSLYPWPG